MVQHIVKPNRCRGEDTPNVLDLVFTDDENIVDNLSYLPGLGNSDHMCITFDFVLHFNHAIDSDDPPRYNVYVTRPAKTGHVGT